YAPEIAGANGRHGIPVGNFTSWVFLTATVTLLYLRLSGDQAAERAQPGAAGSARAGRTAALLLLPYYLRPLAWAIRTRRPRFILSSLLAPPAIARGLRGR